MKTIKENNRGAFLLTHDGKTYNVPWHGGGLDELYRLIHCDYVEAVRLRGPLAGMSIWCDEEGKLKSHTVNMPASMLCRYLCGVDYMAGRCVILSDSPDGESAPLSEQQVMEINNVLRYLNFIMLMRGDEIKATGPRFGLVEL